MMIEPVQALVEFWETVPDGDKHRSRYCEAGEAFQMLMNRAVQLMITMTDSELAKLHESLEAEVDKRRGRMQ